jgi:hypothetical protein
MAGFNQIPPANSRQNCLKFMVRVLGGGFDNGVTGGNLP